MTIDNYYVIDGHWQRPESAENRRHRPRQRRRIIPSRIVYLHRRICRYIAL
jgi:hypothetical protein